MNKEELVIKLNALNLQYPARIPRDILASAAGSNLVVVYGASDDLMEFEGAIDDETGCYDGGTAHIINGALALSECSDGDECPYFQKNKLEAKKIEAVWDEGGISWQYKTDIPHSEFTISEDGEEYCRGIVFSLDELETDVGSKETLDCPFCDGSDIRFSDHGKIGTGEHRLFNVWSTCCYNCGATFPNRYKKQLLVDCWNRRP